MWIDLAPFIKPALQFSGGKDSLACLLMLREAGQLEQVSVYWVNTLDGCPETLAIVDWARSLVPDLIEIRSDARAWRQVFGDPSDLVPASSHFLGVAYGMSDRQLVGRFDCCFHNLMRPMHERMLADGVDAVIRGTKLCDTGRVPHEGAAGEYEVILPIKNWSHEEVFAYLASRGAPANPIYEHFAGISAPECMSCTAWWDDGKAGYLAKRHPGRVGEYRANLSEIKALLQSHLADLESELEVCDGLG